MPSLQCISFVYLYVSDIQQDNCSCQTFCKDSGQHALVGYLEALFYLLISFTITDTVLSYPPLLGALYSFDLDINSQQVTMYDIATKVGLY